ncbi:unannotated protein [freshwater metagenome]|jgi:hypothetical protein|uniref:Unannotated protein n=1 Tax=freshwater metagenome TaxID=449393 RepID=A0A6J6DF64_9ZZZZ
MNRNLSQRPRRTRSGAMPRTPWLAGERGDVPGWVLITLMTAGIVVALWAVAAPALSQLFSTAIDRVVSF